MSEASARWKVHYKQMTGADPSGDHPHDRDDDVCLQMLAQKCPNRHIDLSDPLGCQHCRAATDVWLVHYFFQSQEPADPMHPKLDDCPDQTCHQCGVRACPSGEILHFDCSDGCPACVAADEE
jgi:hypothetical protein